MSRTASDIHLDLLDRAQIASPCPARWEDMAGDDKRRFCTQCSLHVHNLSAMTRHEAEAVVRGAGDGRFCARLWRRADGTVLTQDCPVGFAAVRQRVRRSASRIAAALAMAVAGGVLAGQASRSSRGGSLRLRAVQPIAALSRWLAPSSVTPVPFNSPPGGCRILGKIGPMAATPPPSLFQPMAPQVELR